MPELAGTLFFHREEATEMVDIEGPLVFGAGFDSERVLEYEAISRFSFQDVGKCLFFGPDWLSWGKGRFKPEAVDVIPVLPDLLAPEKGFFFSVGADTPFKASWMSFRRICCADNFC